MIGIDSYDVLKIAQEIDKICGFFIRPRKFTYFQFKRIFKNGTSIVLANHPEFFKEFLENGFIEPTMHLPVNTRQSSYCFWDESLSEIQLSLLKEKKIYHGFTILSRRKAFYDCTTLAMSEPHPSPVAYYFHIMKDLQNFSEFFPTKARHLIEEISKKPLKKTQVHSHSVKRKSLFLPKRSTRFIIGDDVNNYITTYEAMCVQLVRDGKSYKEIGTILSMATTTVKTHLIRLKSRTGLSLQEIALQSFQPYNNSKNIISLGKGKDQRSSQIKDTQKHKRDKHIY